MDEDNCTPMHYAAMEGSVRIAELLFEAQRIDLLTAIGITTEDFKIMVGEHGHQLTPYRYV